MKELKWLYNSKGLTLVEVMASITILSIIIVSFLALFIQSARTNQISQDITDATYIAQTEMEKIYNLSNTSDGYCSAVSTLAAETCEDYTLYKDVEGYYVEIQLFQPDPDNDIGNVLVKVYEDNSLSKLEAQMETIYSWKE
ncbi:prepilin-type N-terminal cleavage/methylation domain-containing protein [Aquibacillus halophilus]|uniref:Prepilin-type N-terminal cleavage/methylation domain-containing protein n=1 Tax=Aquibacillus halophilus TaxID=930132 RepID=A0A6A8DGX9_9BACI|nr:type II secretion system protein [Aquibacillus halophilus]MRH42961.1 prepilin-type N-terminal cleavage/methylation domain-containing protein [Aquibacillus halophilus]